MKLKSLIAAVAAVAALLACASAASATTLEVKGLKQAGAVTVKASLKQGTSILQTDTEANQINTCTTSLLEGSSTVFTGTTVTAPLSTLSYSNCTEGNPTIDSRGSLTVERIGTTTNGTVRWSGLKWTTPSVFGVLTCQTAASPGTDVGTLTGVATGQATLDINAVLECTLFGSEKWTGTYTVTSPEGLGVTG
jgi:hypothetical protein